MPITRHAISYLLDSMPFHVNYVLYLDIDGTLADFQLDPKQSFIPKTTLHVLNCLLRLNIPIILLTGRGVEDAQQLTQGLDVGIAGSHGLDLYLQQKRYRPQLDLMEIKALHSYAAYACQGQALRVEHKDYSIALHYREYPQSAQYAEQMACEVVEKFPNFYLKKGHDVCEIAPLSANKGHAIQRIQHLLGLSQHCPIFIGDDLTDEDGFTVINQLQGISIKVGQGQTHARYQIDNVVECANFLENFTKKIIHHKNRSMK
jgi:trehalose 6-phosphate phosphatase